MKRINRTSAFWLILLLYGCHCSYERQYNEEVKRVDSIEAEYDTLNSLANKLLADYNLLKFAYDSNLAYGQWLFEMYQLEIDSLRKIKLDSIKLIKGQNNQILFDSCNCTNCDSLITDFIETFNRNTR